MHSDTHPFSPPHLSYLHSSLSLTPPIRPDARPPTSFRPLHAETAFLPSAHGSARVCSADGAEAVVGVRAEVERTAEIARTADSARADSWVEVGVEWAGHQQLQRDEDAGVFLEQMIREGVLADGALTARLALGRGWHWRLFVDILLLSPPHTYPLPLLSLTTHLALLNTRLPIPISGADEDPLFNDDWAAAEALYPTSSPARPPATVLAIAVGPNVFFDPSREELAVADVVLSLTFAARHAKNFARPRPVLRAVRTVEPPGRRGTAVVVEGQDGAWKKRAGGVGREVLRRVVDVVVREGGVGEEILAALEGWA